MAWPVGTVADNPQTGETKVWNGTKWEPVARNLQPFDTTDRARMAELSAASAATSETAPLLDVLRSEFSNPRLMMGGAHPLAAQIDALLPGDPGLASTTPFFGPLGASAINTLNQQKDFADRIAQANTRLAIPLAAMLKPVANLELQMVKETIGTPATSREAALSGVTDMTRQQNLAVWRDRKAREWRQAYGSLNAQADRGYDTLAAAPGETFDQYFARWAQTNRAAMENPRGMSATFRPASRREEVDTATGRLRGPGGPPPVPKPPTARDDVEGLLRKYGQ